MDLYEILRAETTRRVESWRDLERFGIRVLTGEACAYGMRVLCDLTDEGLRHVENFFGVLCPSENWNSGAVRSVLLPRSIFGELAAFCLLETGSEAALVARGSFDGVFGMTTGHAAALMGGEIDLEGLMSVERQFRNSRHPQVAGGRNIHAISGRAA